MPETRMPPLLEGEIVPIMKVVKVDEKGIAEPQRLTMLTYFRYTNEGGLHALAQDDATGETVTIRQSAIHPPCQGNANRSSPWRLYRYTDVVQQLVSGVADSKALSLRGLLRKDSRSAKFHDEFEALAKKNGVDLIRLGEALPSNSYVLLYRIPVDADWDLDDNNNDIRDYIDIGCRVERTDRLGAVLPDMRGGDGEDWSRSYAVDLGPTQHHRFMTSFDVDSCGGPMDLRKIAERLRNVATVLRQAGVDSIEQDTRFDANQSIERQDYFGEDVQCDKLFDAANRSLQHLATPAVLDRVPKLGELIDALGVAINTIDKMRAGAFYRKSVLGYDFPSVETNVADGCLRTADIVDSIATELALSRQSTISGQGPVRTP